MVDSTYTGQTLRVKIKKTAAKIIKQRLGVLNGDTNDQDFYVLPFPITTNAEVITDDETEVDVYGDDVEYLDDGSDFLIIGATGKVTIDATENQGGDAGTVITISYYTARTVGMGQNVTLRTDRGLVEVYELGDQDPQEIKEMTIHNDGTLRRFFIDRNIMMVLGIDATPGKPLPYLTLEVAPNGFTAGQPLITFVSCKFGSYDFDASIDAIVSESCAFKALSVTVGTVPA